MGAGAVRRRRRRRGAGKKKKVRPLTGSKMKTAVREAVASFKSHRGIKAATVAGKVKSKYGKDALPKRFQAQVSRLLRGMVRTGKLHKVGARFALANGKKGGNRIYRCSRSRDGKGRGTKRGSRSRSRKRRRRKI